MERRTELLRAAARVYAHHGYRGSTTRRIADEAGVNEVTIFRQFGSKDALIHEAIATCGGGPPIPELPSMPIAPIVELTTWSQGVIEQMYAMRALIRRCMSEREEHPQLSPSPNSGSHRASTQLRAYLTRLREHGIVSDDFDVKAAASMLMGALFADAMGRDVMPDMFPKTSAVAAGQYARLLLRAIGIRTAGVDEVSYEHSSLT